MSEWLLVQPARAARRLRLICLPYAGGGATIFHGWAAQLPDAVEVASVWLPGRGTRFREPAFTEMHALVEALAEALAPELAEPYALFGHSMGARIAFELTRELAARGRRAPARLWLSGSRAPHLPPRRPPIHALPEPEFVAELRRYGGAPPEIFEHEELAELYLPVLRADLALHDTYVYRPGPPLAVPFTVFGGVADTVVLRSEGEAWAQHTSAGCDFHPIPGDHFFVTEHRALVLERIARDLASDLSG